MNIATVERWPLGSVKAVISALCHGNVAPKDVVPRITPITDNCHQLLPITCLICSLSVIGSSGE